jgi:hypothetical protein
MRFVPNHDDQMRALRARLAPETPTAETGVLVSPVQLTRALVDEAIERSRAKVAVKLPAFTATRRAERAAQAHGSMKLFLRNAAAFQNLPHFARRMRE